jgi:hypothetical protein
MKPAFALHLDHDRVTLLHRSGGSWVRVGAVALEEPEFDAALAVLRKTAIGLEPIGLTCKLILPPSQILYREVVAPGPDARSRKQQIRAALEGMTPYAVDDLVFDWSGAGETVRIAVVARETLDEAEEFAANHRFGPVSFVAIPGPGQFGGEPFFGQTRVAAHLLPEGERVLRDNEPVSIPPEHDASDASAEQSQEPPDSATSIARDETIDAKTDLETTAESEAPEPHAADEAASDPADAPQLVVTSASIDLSQNPTRKSDVSAARQPRDLTISPAGVADAHPPDPVSQDDANPDALTQEDAAPAKAEQPTSPTPHVAPTAAQIMANARTAADTSTGETALHPETPSKETGPWRVGWRQAAVAASLALLVSGGVIWSLVSPPSTVGSGSPAESLAQAEPETTGQTTAAIAPSAPAPDVASDLPTASLIAPAPPMPAPTIAQWSAGEKTTTPAPVGAPKLLAQAAQDDLPQIAPPVSPNPAAPLLSDGAGDPAPGPADATPVEVSATPPTRAAPPPAQPIGDIRLATMDLRVDPDGIFGGEALPVISPAAPDAAARAALAPPPVPSRTAATPQEAVGSPESALETKPVGESSDTKSAETLAEAASTTEDAADFAADPALAGARPRARPEGLAPPDVVASAVAPAQAILRPRARPQAQISERAAELAAETAARSAARAAAESAAAIAASQQPETRPQNLAAAQAPATASATGSGRAFGPDIEEDGEPEVTRRAPRIPTSASVAARATVKGGVQMRDMNLIGVFGSSNNRRALVRMPNGQVLRVRVGDKIDGGRVAVIDRSRLIYVKGGRDHVLEIPKG